ncbi:MAG TPA: hypothetical protein VJP58_01855 [Candidatus Nitrosocosmicus sp.]|nr:hypothetical protein [Candidatus Nitrosocosmicus sp.]
MTKGTNEKLGGISIAYAKCKIPYWNVSKNDSPILPSVSQFLNVIGL